MTPKELIEQIKDYADCADASYAMLHYVWENSKNDSNLKIERMMIVTL